MSTLCIFKTHRNGKYSTINLTAEEDNALSWGAKGLHTYLISRPPNWKVYLSELLKRATDGKYSLRSLLQELRRRGYIDWEQKLDEKKRFSETHYDVYETPNEQVIARVKAAGKKNKPNANKTKTSLEPRTDFSHTENPETGNHADGKPADGKPAPNNNHNTIYQTDSIDEGNKPPAFAPKLPLKKYAVEWAMWTAEQGDELFERAFGDKRVWDAADLQGFANLRDSGKNIHEITERFKIYLAEENPWYATRGYSFAEFAKNYNTFSPVIAARKANRNGHSRNGFNDRDRTEDVATNVAEAILMERQANAGY